MITTSKVLKDLIDAKSENNSNLIDNRTLYHHMTIAIGKGKLNCIQGKIQLHYNQDKDTISLMIHHRKHWKITCWFMNLITYPIYKYIDIKKHNRDRWCKEHKIPYKYDKTFKKIYKQYQRIVSFRHRYLYL